MRLLLAFAAILVLGAAVAVFGWQQSEISHLRTQLAQASPPAAPETLRHPTPGPAGLTADDRRFILSQYQDVLTGMNLPPGRASRLQDLLARRIEAALDAQDAAAKAGFAPGSVEMVRAEASAISGVDRQIATLLGPDDDQHFNWLISGAQPPPLAQPAPAMQPAPTSIVVNVNTSAPEEPAYAEVAEQPADAYAYDAPAPAPYDYYGYPFATVVAGRRFARPFVEERRRFEGVASSRPPVFNGGGSGARPSRRVR